MMPAPIKPRALKPGDTIGIVATSSHITQDRIDEGMAALKAMGFVPRLHDKAGQRHGQFAGDEATRVAAFHDYLIDPSIHAVMAMHGGNGALHLLDLIDYGLIRANPKIIVGFSDVTALLNAVTARTGLITFHGPTLTRIARIDQASQKQFAALLSGKDVPPLPATSVREGKAEGILIGGNLSALQSLIGTPYALIPDGAILLIEDINDHVSRYDRMIGHFKNARWFEKLGGIVLGEFLNSLDNEARPFGFTIEERVRVLTDDYDFPVMAGLAVGHGEKLATLPIGGLVRLDAHGLSIVESPVV